MAAADTVFGKILRKEMPATILHEDDRCIVIQDIAPRAPLHALVIPRKAIPSLADATEEDAALLGHCLLVAKKVAESRGTGPAFRVIVNSGEGAGQTVHHLHFHVLGGGKLRSFA